MGIIWRTLNGSIYLVGCLRITSLRFWRSRFLSVCLRLFSERIHKAGCESTRKGDSVKVFSVNENCLWDSANGGSVNEQLTALFIAASSSAMSGNQPEIVIDPEMESAGSLLEGETRIVAETDWRAADGNDSNDSRAGNKHDPGQKYYMRHIQAIDDHKLCFTDELQFVQSKHQPSTGRDITKGSNPDFWPFGFVPVHPLEHILDSDRYTVYQFAKLF